MEELDRQVLALLARPQRVEDLEKGLPDVPKKAVSAALARLEEEGLAIRNKKNKYGYPEAFGCVVGTFVATTHSFSFVSPLCEGKARREDDVFIPPRQDGGAWQGDRVLVKLDENPRPGRDGEPRNEGEVVRVLKRAEHDVTGRLEKRGRAMVLLPDSSRYPEIEVQPGQAKDAQDGDRVAVRIVSRGDRGKGEPPQGVVTEGFGEAGTMEASIAAVLHENGVYDLFPGEALEQADSIPQEVPAEAAARRLDLRDKLIFTIDGDDAKDFDDAVSLETLPNGHLLLGVHIADVSNYVIPGSPLDAEAYRRGTSVYFPGHVVPMLPLALSNGICSLNPEVDRFAFSALLELDSAGGRHGAKFAKTVIRSKARMTYHNVNQILAGDAALCAEYEPLVSALEAMNALARRLFDARVARGALELDIPETEVVVDENGKAADVLMRERGDAEKLIEEFMLLANESVAEYLCRREDPTIYRVHEDPDPDKLRVFASFAKQFGYRVDPGKPQDTAQFQAILEGAKDKPEQRILPVMLLRSLARARYADECIGHYGLHAKFYLHFTSPIRRYPDLVAHRMLYKAISAQEFTRADRVFCEEAAAQSTTREQAAANCEREIAKLYIADYMTRFVGEEFDATVSGVTAFGLFVSLPNLVEGLVRVEDLPGRDWEFDPDKMSLSAVGSGFRYGIGTPLRVRLTAASNVTGQIDFVPADSDKTEAYHRPAAAPISYQRAGGGREGGRGRAPAKKQPDAKFSKPRPSGKGKKKRT